MSGGAGLLALVAAVAAAMLLALGRFEVRNQPAHSHPVGEL